LKALAQQRQLLQCPSRIITDDQGLGILGFPTIPLYQYAERLDAICWREVVRFNQFFILARLRSDRSSLMTGRISLRKCVRDTYNVERWMATSEITMLNYLKSENILTEFWEVASSDNYPYASKRSKLWWIVNSTSQRVNGNKSEISLRLSSKEIRSYFGSGSMATWIWTSKKYSGYCAYLLPNEAIKFIEKIRTSPFQPILSLTHLTPHSQVAQNEYLPENTRILIQSF